MLSTRSFQKQRLLSQIAYHSIYQPWCFHLLSSNNQNCKKIEYAFCEALTKAYTSFIMPLFFLYFRVFSHDVTAAILVSQNNETAAMLVSQTNPVGI